MNTNLYRSVDMNHPYKDRGGARVFAWGGGAKWQNVSLSTAPALKNSLSGGGGGGGGGVRVGDSFPTEKSLCQNYYHNGVGVLSSSPYVTELTSRKTTTNKQTIGWRLPTPSATPLTPRLHYTDLSLSLT